jgi:hypothetical protein
MASNSFIPSSFDMSNGVLYKFSFDRLPHTEYFCYSVNIPGVSAGEVLLPTPTLDVKIHGDKLAFEPLLINFIVSEDLSNYREILDWMFGLYKPLSTDQYQSLGTKNPNLNFRQNIYSDATLHILTNKMNPIVKFSFKDVHPTNLAPLIFDSSITDATPLTTDVTLNFAYFTVEKL